MLSFGDSSKPNLRAYEKFDALFFSLSSNSSSFIFISSPPSPYSFSFRRQLSPHFNQVFLYPSFSPFFAPLPRPTPRGVKTFAHFPRRVATDEKGDNEIDKCRVQASPLSHDIAKYRGSMRCRQIFHAESCCGEREYLCFLQRSSPING